MRFFVQLFFLLLGACAALAQEPVPMQSEKPWQVVAAAPNVLYIGQGNQQVAQLLPGDRLSNQSWIRVQRDAEVVFYHEEMGYFKELSKKGNYRMRDLLPRTAPVVSEASKNIRSVIAQEVIAVQQIDTAKIPRRTYHFIQKERCGPPDILMYTCTEARCSSDFLRFFADSIRFYFYVFKDVDKENVTWVDVVLKDLIDKIIYRKNINGAKLTKEYFLFDYNKLVQQPIREFDYILLLQINCFRENNTMNLFTSSYALERVDFSEKHLVERLLAQAAFEEDSAFELLAKGCFLELLNYPLEAVDCYKRAIEMKPESVWAELFDQENMQRVRMELVEPNFTIFSLHQSAERKQYLKEIYLNRK